MDLSLPLATITPTLDAGVLHVLAATTGWCTAAEVHRRLRRGSDEGVRKVLARLVAQGVVLVDRPGRYPVYLLNREHLAVHHIVALTRLRAQIVEKIGIELASWGVAPLHASLFGSFARDEADTDSDIDVLLVRPAELDDASEDGWLDQLGRLDRRIRAWTGNAAQILDATAATLAQMAREHDPLIDSLRADDVHLYGERLRDLLRGPASSTT